MFRAQVTLGLRKVEAGKAQEPGGPGWELEEASPREGFASSAISISLELAMSMG